MKYKVLKSLWDNKVFKVVITVSLLTAVGLPAWLEASDYPGHENFVYKMLIQELLVGLWVVAFLYLVGELKKISSTAWMLISVAVVAVVMLLAQRFKGLLLISEDGTLSLFNQPIIWMLVATTIGYIVLRFHNRNNLQSK